MFYLNIQLFWLRAKVQFFCNINKKKLHKNRLTVFMFIRSQGIFPLGALFELNLFL